MPQITMPALSPTMEVGTLARWLKTVGDPVKPGDVLAEIETDKATMEIEAVDEGVLSAISVQDGTEDVKVGAVIGAIRVEGEDAAAQSAPVTSASASASVDAHKTPTPEPDVRGYGADPVGDAALAKDEHREHPARVVPAPNGAASARINASPLARRIAGMRGLDLAGLKGTGPNGRIVKADVEATTIHPAQVEPMPTPQPAPVNAPAPAPAPKAQPAPPAPPAPDIPHDAVKLTNMRKVIARRLTESKQTVPHYYLAIDCRLDALLTLRAELNAAQPVKLSVNDLLIKALAVALRHVPDANVSYTGESLIKYQRSDISVAVAIPAGLITPIIVGADTARLTDIAARMKDLAARAKDGKLQPHEYQGGTASLSNLGMYGITQFAAVINPPQGMILAVGAGDRRAWVEGETLVPATVLTATGSFDHRAIDGATGAQLMAAVRDLVEKPLGMLV